MASMRLAAVQVAHPIAAPMRTWAPTCASIQRPANTRFQVTSECGHRDRTAGSNARYRSQIIAEIVRSWDTAPKRENHLLALHRMDETHPQNQSQDELRRSYAQSSPAIRTSEPQLRRARSTTNTIPTIAAKRITLRCSFQSQERCRR